jgi:rod shape determining protein RodA
MRREFFKYSNLDWISVVLYALLVIIGWMSLYSVTSANELKGLLDFSTLHGKQLVRIFLGVVLILIILFSDAIIFKKYAIFFYLSAILLLLGLFVFGNKINGEISWYRFFGFSIQPSEFAKFATALAFSNIMASKQFNSSDLKDWSKVFIILLIPVLLILLLGDEGSAIVFLFMMFALYRGGLPWYFMVLPTVLLFIFILTLSFSPLKVTLFILLIGAFSIYKVDKRRKYLERISLIVVLVLTAVVISFSSNYVFNNVLKPHQQNRINILLGKNTDIRGAGYNLRQSKIAFGSGGFSGKGFLEGTQSAGGFVPEQETDYIFSIVGEEWGFIGTLTVVLLFLLLFMRILFLAEHQKTPFAKYYGYAVVAILFAHFFINIAMVIGLMPTIGIPLPFFSYGGSALWGFTILLFIFLKLDANKVNEW